jgi:hypothetical protein
MRGRWGWSHLTKEWVSERRQWPGVAVTSVAMGPRNQPAFPTRRMSRGRVQGTNGRPVHNRDTNVRSVIHQSLFSTRRNKGAVNQDMKSLLQGKTRTKMNLSNTLS